MSKTPFLDKRAEADRKAMQQEVASTIRQIKKEYARRRESGELTEKQGGVVSFKFDNGFGGYEFDVNDPKHKKPSIVVKEYIEEMGKYVERHRENNPVLNN